MAHDYSYREMKRMQEDAIQRVWEMQRRATLPLTTQDEEVSEKPLEEEQKNHTEPGNPAVSHPQRSKNQRPTRQPRPRQQLTRQNKNDFISKIPDKINHLLKDDELCEQILLIAIIILLMNEKADNILILAILYILAD